MTSKQARETQLSFRVTPEEAREIERLWKASGLRSKQEYLLQAALRGTADIPAPNDQKLLNHLDKLLDQKLDKLASRLIDASSQDACPEGHTASSANTYKVGVCVKGVDANRVLRVATHKWLNLLISQGMLWEQSKSPNGRSTILDPIIEVPEQLIEYLTNDHLPELYHKVIPNYLNLVNLTGFDQLPEQDKESYIRDSLRYSPEMFAYRTLAKVQGVIHTHTQEQLTASTIASKSAVETVLAANSTPRPASVCEQVSVLPEVPESANEAELVSTLLDSHTHTGEIDANTKACTPELEKDSGASKYSEVLASEGSTITPKLPESEPVHLSDEVKVDSNIPKSITRSELANRLSPELTGKGRNTIAINLKSVGLKKVAAWTAQRDPEGISWQPADESREVWNRVL